jgi:hypothetical protein
MHISVIGTGYVGLVTGACFSEFGVNVTCMDADTKRIARLEKGDVPFYEPGITELVAKGIRENRISFTTDVAKAVNKALVIFIAVGTPPRPDGSADLSYVEEVGRSIARTMTGYKVIVTKSTVPVGTGEKLREVISSNQSGKFRFDIVSNPEFLREGSAIEDFMRPNRVVIGADSEQAIAIMKDLYRPLPHRNSVRRDRPLDCRNDQIRIQRLPRHQNFVHQRDRDNLRAVGRRRADGGERDGARQPDWIKVSPRWTGVRWIMLPERSGRSRTDGGTSRLSNADRKHRRPRQRTATGPDG